MERTTGLFQKEIVENRDRIVWGDTYLHHTVQAPHFVQQRISLLEHLDMNCRKNRH